MKKKILLGLVIILIIIQFIPTEKNLSNDETHGIQTKYAVSNEVNQIFKTACNDCHSNSTTYPWYSKIQPVGFWLDHHVNDGKKHLNFSTFTTLPLFVQKHKLDEVIEQVEEKEMPMPSYTYFGLHPGADLSQEQRETIIRWAKEQISMLQENYPADSLKFPDRGKRS